MASFKQDITSAFRILGRAVRRSLGSWLVLVPLSAAVGGLGHIAMWQAGLWSADTFVDPAQQTNQQALLIASELAKMVVNLAWGVLLFPLIDAATIYAWRQLGKGETPGLGGALNWAGNRYRRMFLPHAAAFLSISLGMAVLVPGILFGLMYGFTDAIAATDPKAKRPVARSEKLSRGRRRRIALAWLPYAVWWMPAYLWGIYAAEGQGWLGVLAFGTLDMFLLQIMEMTMYGLYEERIEDARRAMEARKAGEAREAAPS